MNRPYDQDLDIAFSAYVDAREGAHDTQLRDVEPPADAVVCALSWAITALWWTFGVLALLMLVFNAAVFN